MRHVGESSRDRQRSRHERLWPLGVDIVASNRDSASVRRGLHWRRELPRRRCRHEVTGLTFVAVAPDEDEEALAGCNDVAPLKAWVVHGALVRGFGVRLVERSG